MRDTSKGNTPIPFVERRGLFVAYCLIIAVGYAFAHLTSQSMLEGQSEGMLFVRNLVGAVLGSATLWISCSFWAGKFCSLRRLRACAVGGLTLLSMLIVHYLVGLMLGVFSSQVFADNWMWLALSFVVGPAFGLLGSLSHEHPWLQCILGIGFIAEPFATGSLPGEAVLPWPSLVAGRVAGLCLIAGGITIIALTSRSALHRILRCQ